MHFSILRDFFDLQDTVFLAENFYATCALNIKQGHPSLLLTPFSFLPVAVCFPLPMNYLPDSKTIFDSPLAWEVCGDPLSFLWVNFFTVFKGLFLSSL